MAKVDIIMAALNEEKKIGVAIESIIAQSYSDWRLLVCDDGSTDATMSTISRYADQHPGKIIFYRNDKNMGLVYSLNYLLSKTNAKYIARMDADDRSRPTRLEEEVSFLDNNIEYSLVGTAIEKYDDEGTFSVMLFPAEPTKKDFLWGNPFAHPTIMIRSEVIKELNGYFDIARTIRNEDYDLWMRMYAAGYKGYNLSEPLLDYYEGRSSYNKRKYKYRIAEMKTRYCGYKKLGMMPIGLLYAIKPIIVGLIPRQLLISIRKAQLYDK